MTRKKGMSPEAPVNHGVVWGANLHTHMRTEFKIRNGSMVAAPDLCRVAVWAWSVTVAEPCVPFA